MEFTEDLCNNARAGDAQGTYILLKHISPDLVNTPNAQGHSPLFCAASQGHDDIVRVLLKVKGIDVNFQEHHGNTSLHAAVLGSHISVVSLLLSYGADPTIPNHINKISREYAKNDALKVFQYFESGGVKELKTQGYPVIKKEQRKHSHVKSVSLAQTPFPFLSPRKSEKEKTSPKMVVSEKEKPFPKIGPEKEKPFPKIGSEKEKENPFPKIVSEIILQNQLDSDRRDKSEKLFSSKSNFFQKKYDIENRQSPRKSDRVFSPRKLEKSYQKKSLVSEDTFPTPEKDTFALSSPLIFRKRTEFVSPRRKEPGKAETPEEKNSSLQSSYKKKTTTPSTETLNGSDTTPSILSNHQKKKSESINSSPYRTQKRKSENRNPSPKKTQKRKSDSGMTSPYGTQKKKSESGIPSPSWSQKRKSESGIPSPSWSQKRKSDSGTTSPSGTQKRKSESGIPSPSWSQKRKSGTRPPKLEFPKIEFSPFVLEYTYPNEPIDEDVVSLYHKYTKMIETQDVPMTNMESLKMHDEDPPAPGYIPLPPDLSSDPETAASSTDEGDGIGDKEETPRIPSAHRKEDSSERSTESDPEVDPQLPPLKTSGRKIPTKPAPAPPVYPLIKSSTLPSLKWRKSLTNTPSVGYFSEISGKLQENSGKFGKSSENSGKFRKSSDNSGENSGKCGRSLDNSGENSGSGKKRRHLSRKKSSSIDSKNCFDANTVTVLEEFREKKFSENEREIFKVGKKKLPRRSARKVPLAKNTEELENQTKVPLEELEKQEKDCLE